MNNKDSFNEIFGDKNRILVVLAHPDDAEIYCGATISKLTSLGKIVRVVKVTSGNRGNKQQNISTKELEKIRLTEDKKAMKILGIKDENNIYLNLIDGTVDNSLKTIEKIVYQIREFKPDILITHNPEDIVIRYDKDVNWVNHRDHRNTGKSVIDAAYPYSRDTLFFPEQLKNPQLSSHSVSQFLLVDYYDHPDTINIDVTGFTEQRTKAIAAHLSQYSYDQAKESTNFFTRTRVKSRSLERFRYVIAD